MGQTQLIDAKIQECTTCYRPEQRELELIRKLSWSRSYSGAKLGIRISSKGLRLPVQLVR